ncbi:MAG: TetR/AcrR family transcriptional regulator [Ktedonobacterales bacterium]
MPRKPAIPGVDRRQQILEAALAVFAEQGLDGATTQEIASRAGVAQGLIYFYFASKADLRRIAFDQYARVALAQLDERPPLLDGVAADEALQATLTRIVEVMSAPHTISLLRIMTRAGAAGPDEHGRPVAGSDIDVDAFAIRIHAEVRDMLDRLVGQGVLRPVDTWVAAYVVASSLVTMTIQWAYNEPIFAAISRERMIETLVGMLTAWAATPSPDVTAV